MADMMMVALRIAAAEKRANKAEAERDALLALLERMSHMLARYVYEVPLGHQPHMTGLAALTLLIEARAAIAKVGGSNG